MSNFERHNWQYQVPSWVQAQYRSVINHITSHGGSVLDWYKERKDRLQKCMFTLLFIVVAFTAKSQDFITYYNGQKQADNTVVPVNIILAANAEVVYLQPLEYGEPPTYYKVLQHIIDGEEHFIRARDGKYLYSILANPYNVLIRSEFGDTRFVFEQPDTVTTPKGIEPPEDFYECPLTMGTNSKGEWLYFYGERVDVQYPGEDVRMSLYGDEVIQTSPGSWILQNSARPDPIFETYPTLIATCSGNTATYIQ